MLNWKNIRLIFLREVRDQLRDRRTLFMIAVLPLLLYPALGIGMMQLTVLFREQPRTVVLLGAADLPSEPALMAGQRFDARWFDYPEEAGRLLVVSDEPAPEADPDAGLGGARRDALLERARQVRALLEAEDRLAAGDLFGTSGIEVLILVPRGFSERLARVREQLAGTRRAQRIDTGYPRPKVIYNKADEKSQITFNRASEALRAWEKAILADWLSLAQLEKEFLRPVLDGTIDVSREEQFSASIWSRLFPALLVIMSVTGAFYPAIDLVAGEKERGTMETLLICPATRTEIVLGKFLTVMLFSMATALLNLASMGFTGKHMVGMSPTGAMEGIGDVSFPPLWALVSMLALLLPLAALFSALCLALATFAKSSKEGQYYLTPLLMATLGLTIFCLSPGVELTPQYSIVPVVGPALLLKGLLLTSLSPQSLVPYVAPVLLASCGYAALALWWAVDQFNREEVLFREAERFELRLWLKHLLRDKEALPSFSEAAFCFVLIMMLQFFSIRYVQQPFLEADPAQRGPLLLRVLIIQQIALIASPALFMGVMLTTRFSRTFRLAWPGWRFLAAGAVLPCLLHPVSVELLGRMHWFFGELPQGAGQILQMMNDPAIPLWLTFAAFAVVPALCEELAFRGFILSGLARRGRTALAVVLSSLAFGVMHMVPQQVFNAALMGLVLGLLAVRSGSLLPCVLFHLVNNALGLVHGRYGVEIAGRLPGNALVAVEDQTLRYQWPVLAACLVLAVPMLYRLARPGGSARNHLASAASAAREEAGNAAAPREAGAPAYGLEHAAPP
jgi:sodium transport system permease protein